MAEAGVTGGGQARAAHLIEVWKEGDQSGTDSYRPGVGCLPPWVCKRVSIRPWEMVSVGIF